MSNLHTEGHADFEAWAGCAALLRDAVIVIRIGGTRVDKDGLLAGLRQSLGDELAGYEVRPLHAGATTANRYEHDFAFSLQ